MSGESLRQLPGSPQIGVTNNVISKLCCLHAKQVNSCAEHASLAPKPDVAVLQNGADTTASFDQNRFSEASHVKLQILNYS